MNQNMDWYEIRKFKDNVEALEGFFLEMAANEKRIRAYGLHLALQLDSSKGGLAAIKSFTEDLSRIRRIASYIDRTIGQELESMMGDGLLLQQLPIVALHLRLCEARLASKV